MYRTSDWQLESDIQAVFEHTRDINITMACRLSWSPDAQSLVAVNAASGLITTAAIVPRGKWPRVEEEEIDSRDHYVQFVGHVTPISCAVCLLNPLHYHV